MKSFLTCLMLCLAPFFLHSNVDLGTASSFGALGAADSVTLTRVTVNGDLGISPGTVFTLVQPVVVTGTTNANDAKAMQAHADALSANNAISMLIQTTVFNIGTDISGQILGPGVYDFLSSSVTLNGPVGAQPVTLDGHNDPNAVFVFRINNSLTVSTNIVLVNGANPYNVYWQVGGAATFVLNGNPLTPFNGNVLAQGALTATNTVFNGSLISLNYVITLTDVTVTASIPPTLTLLKTHPVAPFIVGQEGNFTLAVGNKGAFPTSGLITLSDTLPTGLTFVPGSGAGWTIHAVGQTVTATTTTPIPASGSAPPFTITVLVGNAAVPSVTNIASVSGGGAHNTTTSTDIVLITRVDAGPILTLSKTHSPESFIIGQQGLYTLTVGNKGAFPTSGLITISDTLPTGLTFVPGSGLGPAGTTFSSAGQLVTITYTPSIALGGTVPFSFQVTVDSSLAGTTVINNATATGGGATNPALSTDPATVIGPVLSITKTHSPEFFTLGLQGIYSIVVSNTGPVPTVGTITLTDILPQGVTFISGSGAGWTVSPADNQTIIATTATPIPAGGFAPTLTLLVNVAATAGPSLINTAIVSGGGSVVEARAVNVAPVNFNVSPPRNLRGCQYKRLSANHPVNLIRFKKSRTGNAPIEYRIYRDPGLTDLAKTIKAYRELQFKDRNRECGVPYPYYVVAVDAAGALSAPASVTVKPRN